MPLAAQREEIPGADEAGNIPTKEDLGYDDETDYDYAAAKEAGIAFDRESGQHGDSRFKKDWHERRFLPTPGGIFDTKYNRVLSQDEFLAEATPVQKLFLANTKESVPSVDVLSFINSAQKYPDENPQWPGLEKIEKQPAAKRSHR